jgi:hypothetical protein
LPENTSHCIVEQVAWNISSLLLKVIVQKTNFQTKLKEKVSSKVIKMPSWNAWV